MVLLPAGAVAKGPPVASPSVLGLGLDEQKGTPATCTTGAHTSITGTTLTASSSTYNFGNAGQTPAMRELAKSLPQSTRLVRDRFQEFQSIARERGNISERAPDKSGSLGSINEKKAEKVNDRGFMRDFFTHVNAIQSVINQGKANVKKMNEVLEEALMATTQDRQKHVSDRLQELVMETNQQVAAVKDGLDRLKAKADVEEAKNSNSSEVKIRRNMQQAMAKKHQQLLLDFQRAQMEFKKALEQRQTREMEILMPEASDEERRDMIEAGETTALVVAKKMAGAHALLLDEVQRIREKHQDILKLEASISDLAQMFQEIAVLVDSQGEMLDTIEGNVGSTKGYVAKAEKELLVAKKQQMKHQRCMCWITIIITILAIIILLPVLLK